MQAEDRGGFDVVAGTTWIIVGIVLLIAEVFIPGFAVAALGIAGIVTGIVALYGVGVNGQLIVFAVTSLLVFISIRPLVLRYMDRHGNHVRTNAEALVGRMAIVSERIDPEAHTGRVDVLGDNWRAIAVDHEVSEPGQSVEVVRVEGTKLYVKRQA